MTNEYWKNYYEANKERLRTQNKAYYHANREQILERKRLQREADPEASKTYWQEYYKKNKLRLKMKRELAKDKDTKDV